MARIEVIPDDDWVGPLGELYPRVVDPAYGRVDHILAIHSLNLSSMAAHQGLYELAMAGTATLRKAERELIALVVSLTSDADVDALREAGHLPGPRQILPRSSCRFLP